MQITVTSRSGEINESMKEYAAKKLKKLERLLPRIDSVQITEDKERAWHIVEIHVMANGLLVRGQERSGELRSAIDMVVEKLERQIKKYRTKVSDHTRRTGIGELPAVVSPVTEEELSEETEQIGAIVRSKRFAMKPLSPDEAAAELELLGHDFYVFTNAETDQVNVIYRRQDGNYGLIEPDF
jgi:putative sigma-54 modulation protein